MRSTRLDAYAHKLSCLASQLSDFIHTIHSSVALDPDAGRLSPSDFLPGYLALCEEGYHAAAKEDVVFCVGCLQ